jgi:type IV secretion system protein VirB2
MKTPRYAESVIAQIGATARKASKRKRTLDYLPRVTASRSLPVIVLMLTMLLMSSLAAQAQVVGGGTDPTTILQAIITYLTGPFGQAIGVLAVIGAGLLFWFGRFSLIHLAATIGGLVLVFGAAYLVQQFVGGA